MSNQEARKANSQWWRWPFVLIAPPLVSLIAAFIFYWLQWFGMRMFGGYSEDGWMMLYISPLFTAIMLGWSFSWTAAMIAPRAKFHASAVMSLVLTTMGVIAVVEVFTGEVHSDFEALSLTLMTGAVLCGLLGGLVQIKKSGIDE